MDAVVIKKTPHFSGLTCNNSLFFTVKTFTASPSALQGKAFTTSDLEPGSIYLAGMPFGAHCVQLTTAGKQRAGGSTQDFLWL